MATDETCAQRNKATTRRLATEVLNGGWLDVIDGLYSPWPAGSTRARIEQFQASFPGVRTDIIELIAEDDAIVGHFSCPATHTDTWLGYTATGRRFQSIDEIGIYRLRDARITQASILENNLSRPGQLGLLGARSAAADL
jgi:hypothetical protein